MFLASQSCNKYRLFLMDEDNTRTSGLDRILISCKQ